MESPIIPKPLSFAEIQKRYDSAIKMRDKKPLIEEDHIEAKETEENKEEPKKELPTSYMSLAGRKPFIRMSCFALSAAASMASLYYTNEWFEPRSGWLMAKVMTFIVVFTLIISPQLISALWENNKKTGAMLALLITGVSGSFSMTTTIGALYDSNSEQYIANEEASKAATAFTDARGRITSLEADKARSITDEDRLRRTLSLLEFKGITSGTEVNTANARLNAAIKNTQDIEKKLEAARIASKEEAMQSGASAAKADRKDFISYLGTVLPFGRKWVELMVNGFPAIFVDIIAPFMLHVALTI